MPRVPCAASQLWPAVTGPARAGFPSPGLQPPPLPSRPAGAALSQAPPPGQAGGWETAAPADLSGVRRPQEDEMRPRLANLQVRLAVPGGVTKLRSGSGRGTTVTFPRRLEPPAARCSPLLLHLHP